MLFKINLKNANKAVIIDDFVKEHFDNDLYLKSLEFEKNLRLHSSGYAVFQKAWKQKDGTYKTETIYLHKRIAEKFIPRPESGDRLIVRVINGNKLDCRVKNLEWATMSKASRKGRNYGETGFRGVRKDGNRYRATIYVNRKAIHIGMFLTAEEAALAYNEKSKEYFGDEGKINSVSSEALAKIKKQREGKNGLSLGMVMASK
ncbi:MAG: Pathogenesis-related transcriptional factor and ERF protein [Microscillaceae bacterium]|nr:Pathogenesis-related transcriptional factor and ERF protein [Microscillaceae bacterium]